MKLRQIQIFESLGSGKHQKLVNDFLTKIQNTKGTIIHSIQTYSHAREGTGGVSNLVTSVDHTMEVEVVVPPVVEEVKVETKEGEERAPYVIEGSNLEGLGVKQGGHVPGVKTTATLKSS